MSDETDHLADLSDGAGCAEVWEHLSAQRDSDSDADDENAETSEAEAEADDPDGDDVDAADATLLCP
ncbi:hypothetical protein [Halohasta salina]|uniref:hypothetical protein n=1 Tax=Halohasta salina TaxID=2961621 RepID=UPI0020A4220A|nr:hypothetical protein [Halohasta salina]